MATGIIARHGSAIGLTIHLWCGAAQAQDVCPSGFSYIYQRLGVNYCLADDLTNAAIDAVCPSGFSACSPPDTQGWHGGAKPFCCATPEPPSVDSKAASTGTNGAVQPAPNPPHDLDGCVSFNVAIVPPGNGTFSATFKNSCGQCVEFQPISAGRGASGDCPMSNFLTLGQPISSVSLNPGGTLTLFFNCGIGTWQTEARNPHSC